MTNRNNRTHSDRTGSSRSSVRLRQRLFAFTALSMALVLALAGMGALPGAEAYVSVDGVIPIDAGDIPKVKTSLTHTPAKLDKDATGTYSGSVAVDFPASAANTTYTAEIYVRQDQDARFAPVPRLDSFSISGLAVGKKQLTKVDDNTWKLSLEGIKVSGQSQLNINFSARFTVSDKVLPGQSLSASLSAKVRPSANIALINPQPSVVKWNSDGCSGTLEMKGEVATRDSAGNPTTGGWLVDVKFADPNGKRDAQLDPLVLNSDNFKITPPGATSALSGKAFNDFIGGSEFRSPDATKPIFGIAEPLTNSSVFLDSLNFPYDPTTFTGKTAWLEPGTTIAVKRTFRLRDCALHFAKDFVPERDIAGVQFQIARPLLEASDQAVDSFDIPGDRPEVGWCEGVYFGYSIQQSGKNDTTGLANIGVDVFVPGTGSSSNEVNSMHRVIDAPTDPFVFNPLRRSVRGGVAASEKYKDWIYVMAQPPFDLKRPIDKFQKVYRVNTTDGEFQEVFSTKRTVIRGNIFKPDVVTTRYVVGNLSFDPAGRLWAMNRDTSDTGPILMDRYPLKPDGTVDHTTDSNNGDTGLPVGQELTANTMQLPRTNLNPELGPNTRWTVRDLVFFKNGDMLLLAQDMYSGEMEARRFSEGNLGGGMPLVFREHGELWGKYKVDPGKEAVAFAWGPDGKLYGSLMKPRGSVGSNDGYNLTSEVYEFPNDTSGKAPLAVSYVGQQDYLIDAASCAYGEATPAKPSLKVAKAPVDPKTGLVGKFGSAADNVATVNTDGTVTVQYVIAVTNNSDEPRSVEVTEEFHAPPNFSLNGDKPITYTQIGNNDSPAGFSSQAKFSFNSGTIAPNDSNYFLITVNLKGTKEAISSTENAACNMDTGGGSGFFNHTEIEGDQKEPDNNACIPREPMSAGHLILKKKIWQYNGNLSPSILPRDDAGLAAIRNFELVAIPSSINSGALQPGIAGSPQDMEYGVGTGVDTQVLPGFYKLGENIKSIDSAQGDWRLYKDWSCNGDRYDSEKGSVEVRAGETVECIIENIRRPKFKIQKFASFPDGSNGNTTDSSSHFGQVVKLDPASGEGNLAYDIVVTNLSSFDGYTGPLTDTFIPPLGVKVSGNMKIAIISNNVFGNQVQDFKESLSLENDSSVQFASALRVGAGDSVRFRVTIPIIADTTVTTGGGTIFDQNKEKLGKCSKESDNSPYVAIGDSASGIVNGASLDNEDKNYINGEGNWFKDNFACIPVMGEPRFYTRKVATYPEGKQNHLGEGVEFKLVDPMEFNYTIEVVNDSVFSGTTEQLTDHFDVPAGMKWAAGEVASVSFKDRGTGAKVSGGVTQFNQQQAHNGIQLASTIGIIPARKTVAFDISIPLSPDLAFPEGSNESNFTKNLPSLKQCNIDSDGYVRDPISGVVNKVSLAGEVQDIGEKDNRACIPVIPPDAVSAPPLPLTGGLAKLQVLIIGLIVTAIGGAWASFDLIRRRRSTV